MNGAGIIRIYYDSGTIRICYEFHSNRIEIRIESALIYLNFKALKIFNPNETKKMFSMIYKFQIKHKDYSEVDVDSGLCIHCRYCAWACQEGVLALDRKTMIVSVVNPDNCNSCNLCACPYGARTFIPHNAELEHNSYALIGSQVYSR